MTVNQEAPVFTLSASSAGAAHVGPDANTLNFDLTTTLEEEWEVTVDNDATLTRTRAGNTSSVTGTGNASFSVNIQPNGIGGDNPKVYTVTASCHGITRTFTIEQEALVFNLNASEGNATADGWKITRKASQTTASFTVTSNSADTWDISGSENVTTATKDGSTVNIEFANNMDGTAPVERTVTVSIEFGGNTISRTFTIHHNAINWVTGDKTINTTSSTFTQAGSYNGTSSLDIQSLTFTSNGNTNLYAVGGSYITLQRGQNANNPRTTTLTISAKKITKIIVNWSTYAVNDNNTSISAGGGSVAFSNNTTTWTSTNDSGSDSVSLQFTVASNATRPRISSIQVFYTHGEE